MKTDESIVQLESLLEAWDLNEACLNQTDIEAIKRVLKELSLKDEEYNILKVTSEEIEEEQRRQIYELQRKIDKAISFEEKDWQIFYDECVEKGMEEEAIETALHNKKIGILRDEEEE